MSSQRRFKVVENFVDGGQFQPENGGYVQLDPETIYDLLDSADKHHNATDAPNRISARALLERMSQESWECTATAHEGGRPGMRPRPNDPYLHFNIWFNRGHPRHYHVRCRELQQGGLLVFQVTW